MKHSASEVATRMRAIEDNIEGECAVASPPLDLVVATLLGIEYDDVASVLEAEADRVLALMGDWYRRHGIPSTAINTAGLAFVQGVTFAVAAHRLANSNHNDR